MKKEKLIMEVEFDLTNLLLDLFVENMKEVVHGKLRLSVDVRESDGSLVFYGSNDLDGMIKILGELVKILQTSNMIDLGKKISNLSFREE